MYTIVEGARTATKVRLHAPKHCLRRNMNRRARSSRGALGGNHKAARLSSGTNNTSVRRSKTVIYLEIALVSI